jgi:hypothetical protein
MDRQRTGGPLTLLERVGVTAGAGSYVFLYGLAYQLLSTNSGADGAIGALFLLLVAVGISVGGGALLSKVLGVSTWRRSTLVSAAAHAIGIPLWNVTYLYLTFHPVPHAVFDEAPLVSFCAAAYAFVVPLVVVFSSYRRDALGGLAITSILAVATIALPVASVLVDSEGLALASGAVAWSLLPAVTVLGSGMIRARN